MKVMTIRAFEIHRTNIRRVTAIILLRGDLFGRLRIHGRALVQLNSQALAVHLLYRVRFRG